MNFKNFFPQISNYWIKNKKHEINLVVIECKQDFVRGVSLNSPMKYLCVES